jgi:hypothetical protein
MDVKNKPTKLNQSVIEHYSKVLGPLWESYIHYNQIGIASSSLTMVLIAQFLKDSHSLDHNVGLCAKGAIILAGLGGICYTFCRWFCQIIMERQVYGDANAAKQYFALCETRPPNALLHSAKTLNRYLKANSLLRVGGTVCMALSWGLIAYALFIDIELLSAAR